MFGELYYWLILIPYLENATRLINDDSFNLSTDFVVGSVRLDNIFVLYDIYNPCKARNGKINITRFGSWSKSARLNVSLTQNKYHRRLNLHGLVWRVAYFSSKYRPHHVPLEEHLQDYDRTGTKDGLPKFGYSIVKHLSEMFNSSIVLREYAKWKKGDRSGPMSRALENDKIDITGSLISVIPEKLSILKFVYPAWPFRTCFMLRSPQPNDIKIREIFGPFDTDVWWLCFLLTTGFAIGMGMTLCSSSSQANRLMYFSDTFLISIGCVCQQGTQEELNNASTRIAFINMMVFSILMYNFYSALVVTARLNESILKLKDSLITLAKTDLTIASEPMIYFEFLMKDYGQDAEYFNRTKWQHVPEPERFMLPERGMQLVKRGGFAYHTHPDVGYPYVYRLYDNREICELTEIHLGRLSFRSIAIAYNSSFVEISKVGFAWMSDVGIRHRQLTRWTSRKPHCRNDILSESSITIYEFAPQLIILFTGLILVLAICGGEILVANYRCNERLKYID